MERRQPAAKKAYDENPAMPDAGFKPQLRRGSRVGLIRPASCDKRIGLFDRR